MFHPSLAALELDEGRAPGRRQEKNGRSEEDYPERGERRTHCAIFASSRLHVNQNIARIREKRAIRYFPGFIRRGAPLR